MFIDYLTLVMINMVAGSALLAHYMWRGIDQKDQRAYAPAFLIVGAVSMITGLHLSFTWPLPGAYNVGYGDTTTLFGAVFLGAGIALSQGWDLAPVALYAFFAGVDALIVGARIYTLGITKEPVMSAIGFLTAGLGGIGAYPFFAWFRNNKAVRWLAVAVLVATVVLWAITFYGSLWAHMESFSKWVPATMGK